MQDSTIQALNALRAERQRIDETISILERLIEEREGMPRNPRPSRNRKKPKFAEKRKAPDLPGPSSGP